MANQSHKVAIITGAARRIGAVIARTLHAQGFNIIIHYCKSSDEASKLSNELNQQRSNSAHALSANLDNTNELTSFAQQARQYWGRVDALINNASRFYPTVIGQASETDWDALINSNVKGAFFLSQTLAPALRQQQGCIINIIDIYGQKPLKNHSIYCIAKAGLAMMTQSLAKDLAPDIRVNGISPGAIMWPESKNGETLSPEEKTKILEKIPLYQTGNPQDIARTIAFLLDDAPYISGQILSVDGGRSLEM